MLYSCLKRSGNVVLYHHSINILNRRTSFNSNAEGYIRLCRFLRSILVNKLQKLDSALITKQYDTLR